MRATVCAIFAFAMAAHAAELNALTLEIKGDDGSSILIRLLENQKYQSYMSDEIDLHEFDLPKHMSKEKFTAIWKIAETASKNEVEGTFRLPPTVTESYSLILRMNGKLRTYRFRPDDSLPKPPDGLEQIRRTLSGLTKW